MARTRSQPPVPPPKQGVNLLEEIFASVSPKTREEESVETLSKKVRLEVTSQP